MLPNFGSLRLGSPTGNLALVASDGEKCAITQDDLRKGEIAWQLLVYKDKNLPLGTGEGRRDAPANIQIEPHYYDLMSIAQQLSMRPYSPITRSYVVPSDRLACVELANTMISDPEEKFAIRDYENFYDIANEEFDWHEYYARNEAELLNDRDQDENWNEGEFPIAGMSPVQRGRPAPSEAERAAQAAAPPPPTNPPEVYYAVFNPPGNRDGITRENYEATGLQIFLRLLGGLRDIDDLDDNTVTELIHVWLCKFVISPSELYALFYRVAMMGVYDENMSTSGISERAYNLAKDQIAEHMNHIFLSRQLLTPEEWAIAPNSWLEDVREQMQSVWDRFETHYLEGNEFYIRASTFWGFDERRLQAERDFVKKANEMYERVVGSYRLGPDRSLRTIIAEHTFDIERVKAIEWITSPDRNMEGYDVRRPVDLTEQEAQLIRNAVNQYFTDSYIALLVPIDTGPDTTWHTAFRFTPKDWAKMATSMRWLRLKDQLEDVYTRWRGRVTNQLEGYDSDDDAEMGDTSDGESTPSPIPAFRQRRGSNVELDPNRNAQGTDDQESRDAGRSEPYQRDGISFDNYFRSGVAVFKVLRDEFKWELSNSAASHEDLAKVLVMSQITTPSMLHAVWNVCDHFVRIGGVSPADNAANLLVATAIENYARRVFNSGLSLPVGTWAERYAPDTQDANEADASAMRNMVELWEGLSWDELEAYGIIRRDLYSPMLDDKQAQFELEGGDVHNKVITEYRNHREDMGDPATHENWALYLVAKETKSIMEALSLISVLHVAHGTWDAPNWPVEEDVKRLFIKVAQRFKRACVPALKYPNDLLGPRTYWSALTTTTPDSNERVQPWQWAHLSASMQWLIEKEKKTAIFDAARTNLLASDALAPYRDPGV